MSTAAASEVPGEFSLIPGGPLYQFFMRAHLTDTALQHVVRRVVVLSLVAWLPLLLLSILEGTALGGNVKMPFLLDADVQMRFLLALPILIAAELVVHRRMRVVVNQFTVRGLVPDSARAKFDAAITSALRLRNSAVAEILLLLTVYLLGVLVIWRNHAALHMTSWYGTAGADGKLRPSLAGWWFGCLSLPLVQFILIRWYFRIFIWARFLWQVSRIELNINPIHPDRSGGLGFLGNITFAFAPLLVAQGVLLAGVMANKIFYAGARLPDFKMELLAVVSTMILIVVAPTLVFIPRLASAKRAGLVEYGILAQRYVREFDQKWMRGGAGPDEQLIGSADIQSLADLGNSYEVVKGMKAVPITKEGLLQLVLLTLLPVAPLVLTMIPLSDLLDKLVDTLL
jgi:hypothetical protein